MLPLTDHSDHLPPSDVCLLLRSHAEQHWLKREVAPLLTELEHGEPLPEEERSIALAYLEVTWIEAARRAIETDAAYACLGAPDAACGALNKKARAYRADVRALRERFARRVARAIVSDDDELIGEPGADVLPHERAHHRADYIRSGTWRPGSTSSRTRPTQTAN